MYNFPKLTFIVAVTLSALITMHIIGYCWHSNYGVHGDSEGKFFLPSSAVQSIQNGRLGLTDHKELLTYIRHHILGPSKESYNLNYPQVVHNSQAGQSQLVDKELNQLHGGFFIECGAADGESFSNSLFFEKERNWTGLLIEPNPDMFKMLMEKQRKAYQLNVCLSPRKIPKMMVLRPAGFFGGLEGTMDGTHLKAIEGVKLKVDVQCFPLADILEALGRIHINYMSLDVEGPEVEILQTIPWDKITIDIITVEYALWDGRNRNLTGGQLKLNKIRHVLQSTGLYQEIAILDIKEEEFKGDGGGLDVAFKRRDLVI